MFVIDFQPQIFAQMIEAVRSFDEDHVLTGIPPEVDGHSATTEALKRIKGNGQIAAIDQVAGDVVLLAQLKEAIKSLESQEDEVSNRIKAALGECEKGTVNGDVVVTWGSRSSSRFDQKSFKADHSDLAAKYVVTSVFRDGLRFKKQKEALK
jgi:predicted phage-related endonuclease